MLLTSQQNGRTIDSFCRAYTTVLSITSNQQHNYNKNTISPVISPAQRFSIIPCRTAVIGCDEEGFESYCFTTFSSTCQAATLAAKLQRSEVNSISSASFMIQSASNNNNEENDVQVSYLFIIIIIIIIIIIVIQSR